jgi:hypothetical protein
MDVVLEMILEGWDWIIVLLSPIASLAMLIPHSPPLTISA